MHQLRRLQSFNRYSIQYLQISKLTTTAILNSNDFSALQIEILPHKNVCIYEASTSLQEKLVDKAFESNRGSPDEDPYGSVVWPAAIALSKKLLRMDLSNSSIVEIGCGTGLVSLALGKYSNCHHVTATDYRLSVLDQVNYAWNQQSTIANRNKVCTSLFDLNDFNVQLPSCNLLVMADVLYNPLLGRIVARRVIEALRRGTRVIISDSPGRQGRKHFLEEIQTLDTSIHVHATLESGIVLPFPRHHLIAEQKLDPIDVTIFEFSLSTLQE